jgi:hypothetical protein
MLRVLLMSTYDPRFDESLDRTDPKRARAIGIANTSSGAGSRRLEGAARAHERRVAKAHAMYVQFMAHATKAKRARGEYIGGPAPYGFAVTSDGTLDELPDERAAIVRAVELRSCGYSLRLIAAQLADDGHVSRTGGPFHPQSLARILAAYDARAAFETAAKTCGIDAPAVPF